MRIPSPPSGTQAIRQAAGLIHSFIKHVVRFWRGDAGDCHFEGEPQERGKGAACLRGLLMPDSPDYGYMPTSAYKPLKFW
jgi:hypothetical protein